MTVGVLALMAVVLLLFMAVVAGLVVLGIKLFTHLQSSYMSEVRLMNQERSAERKASQEAYVQFMEQQEQREQIIDAADKAWLATPESAVEYDDDLKWEEARDG